MDSDILEFIKGLEAERDSARRERDEAVKVRDLWTEKNGELLDRVWAAEAALDAARNALRELHDYTLSLERRASGLMLSHGVAPPEAAPDLGLRVRAALAESNNMEEKS